MVSGSIPIAGGPDRARRRLIVGGSAVAAGAWVTPSVLTLDRVAAATGSCAASVQVDWSIYANNQPVPGTITANDGTIVTITSSDPFGVAGPRHGTVRPQMLGGLSNFLTTEMSGGSSGQYVELDITFSQPVQLCFTLLGVDRRDNWYEDTLTMTGSLSGVPVTLGAGDMAVGPATSVVAEDTVRGILNIATPNPSADANVDVTFPAEIDRVVLRLSDVTAWSQTQEVGVHNFLWC